MNSRGVMEFLYKAMPDDGWVNFEWAYVVLRAEYGARFTTPIKLMMWLVAHGRAERRRLTRNENNQLVSEFKKLKGGRPMPTIFEIQEAVAKAYEIPTRMMKSPNRAQIYAWPRQVAYYFCRNYTSASYPEIGRQFGDRDHTTIMHGVSEVEKNIRDHLLPRDLAIVSRLSRRFEESTPAIPPGKDGLLWKGQRV